MKIRTAKLTEAALNYAVALAEKLNVASDGRRYFKYIEGFGWDDFLVPDYAASVSGDDIIDREKIETRWIVLDADGGGYWQAQNLLTDTYGYTGTTRRIAAMRCHVASKLGDEVEIPEELT